MDNQCNSLKTENQQLKEEIAVLCCQFKGSKAPLEELAAHDEEIGKLGNVFAHFFSFWIQQGTPSPFHIPCPSVAWHSKDQYLNPTTKQVGQTAELYACIPPKYHE
jgi:hypothetical protein